MRQAAHGRTAEDCAVAFLDLLQNREVHGPERARCADDPWYFLTTYAITYDEMQTSEIPFPDFAYVKELIIDNLVPVPQGNIHVTKTRRFFCSWAWMGAYLWALTFTSWPLFVMSLKASYADDGGGHSTWRSLAGKIRFMHERLPLWLRAPLIFKLGLIQNPKTGSFLVAESTSDDPARGGGFVLGLADEFATIPHSEMVLSALGNAVVNLTLLSTPKGKANAHGRIWRQGSPQYKKVNILWSDPETGANIHEGRDRAWRDNEVRRLNLLPHLAAQELDGSYEGSVPYRILYNYDASIHMAPTPYRPDLAMYSFWDFGASSQTAIVFCQVEIVNVRGVDLWRLRFPFAVGGSQKPDREFATMYREALDAMGCRRSRDYGDPSGWGMQIEREKVTSRIRNLADLGIHLQKAPVVGMGREDMWNDARHFLEFREPALVQLDPVNAADLGWDMENYRYKTDKEGRPTGDPDKTKFSSHFSDAYTFAACMFRHSARGTSPGITTAEPENASQIYRQLGAPESMLADELGER